jgi:Ca2+-binding RTX toxin-like protein
MFTVSVGATGGLAQSTISTIVAITQAAANYWGRYIDHSLASIDISIDFVELGADTLAQAGTDYYFAYSSGGFDFYDPATVIELVTGIDENGANPDIPIEIDLSSVTNNEFNLGGLVDGVSTGGAGYDLWTVLVHEIAHGLGLLSFIDEPGSDRTSFDQFVFQNGGTYYFDGPDPNFGPIALDDGIAHLASGLSSVLSPTISSGFARYLNAQDVSIFGDIAAPLKRPTAGDDELSGFGTRSDSAAANPDLHGLSGHDTIIGLPTKDRLFGDDGNDNLYGSNGDDLLDGGEGADTLKGDVGTDTLNGGNGTDAVDYSAGNAAVSVNLATNTGGGGVFGADAYISIEKIIGTAFGDTLQGSANADAFFGGAGGDNLAGANGDDTLSGGDSPDTLAGGAGVDQLQGDAGADSLAGGDDNDVVYGAAGADTADGGAGADTILGGNSSDMLAGGLGDDSLSGEAGGDTLDGGDGADSLLGGDNGDSLNGGLLNDTARGGAGADTMRGGDGVDSLFGDTQSDQIFGDAGDDTVDGGTGDDTVDGGTQKDRIFTGSGFDSLIGGGGNDTLQGGNDDDTLLGGAAFDVLEGGDGNDSLEGGDFNDFIFGNAGDDTIVFNLGDDIDTLRDFTAGAGVGDVIRLVGFGAAFDTFTEVLAAATDDGTHTTIDLGGGDSLILRNVLVGDLAADDFAFG